MLCHEKFHISAVTALGNLYIDHKKKWTKGREGCGLVSLNDKFEMKITKCNGYFYRVRTGVLCGSHGCHPQLHRLLPFVHHCAAKSVLLTAVQPAMQLPQEFFFFFFLVPSCGKFLNSCFKSATQKRNPPSCGPAVAENSILLLLLLVWGPPKLPSLKASIKPAEGLIPSSSPEFGGIITRVAGFT